jgi:hypothetical protein
MIIGSPTTVAIESGVSRAYAELGMRALGFFIIRVAGQSFGVREADATLLACSFDSVERRIAHRGRHVAPFATEPCGRIADAFRRAIYAPDEEKEDEFGLSCAALADIFHSSELMWAPDGDEAFDDGSYVLQFDVGDRVRVIGFRCLLSGAHDPRSIAEAWVDATDFYHLLQSWRDQFSAEWERTPKVIS